jgi:hypothetical protein
MSSVGDFPWSEAEFSQRISEAVKAYWQYRKGQSKSQGKRGVRDAGTRGEVTGGQHLNAVLTLLVETARAAGFSPDEIKLNTGIELPGFFRPQKRWDVIVVRRDQLCAAVELKSQVGSFGNNFNNRSEEAIGNSTDFWTAFREGRMGKVTPWLGYFFFLEQAEKSTRPVGLKKSIFPPFEIFEGTSYAERYAILCERLVLERKYTRTALLLAPRGKSGAYTELNPQLGLFGFATSLHAHLSGCR